MFLVKLIFRVYGTSLVKVSIDFKGLDLWLLQEYLRIVPQLQFIAVCLEIERKTC